MIDVKGEPVSEGKDWAPRRVLVGYDDSDGSKDAISLARTLGARSEAEFLLVNVLAYPGPMPVAYRLLGYDEAPGWKTFFRQAEEELAGHETEHRTYAGGAPAKVLNNVAETEGVDLVVVGSPHRGAIGRTILGSVAEKLLHGASVAVVAAPRGYRDRVHDGFARVVVGYDGSAEAEVALHRGAAFARREDIELHLISVTTPPTLAPGPFAGPIPPVLPDAVEVVARGVRAVGDGVDARGEARAGSTTEELAGYCGPDDLLLVGSRSYGPLGRTLLGSVSSTLIHAAPCPVLVVPRPHEVAAHGEEPVAAAAESA